MSSIEGVEDPFGPETAVRCGLLDAIRKNSQSAQPAKKSTRVLSLVKIIRITATNNGSFAPEYAEVCACIPSMGVQAHTLFLGSNRLRTGQNN